MLPHLLALACGVLWGVWIGAPPALCLSLAALTLLFCLPGRHAWALAAACWLCGAAFGDFRATSQVRLFETHSPGRLRGKVEAVDCDTSAGCRLKLTNATFQGETLDTPVSLWHPGALTAGLGDRIEIQARLESTRPWSNPSGRHPLSSPFGRWRAFAKAEPSVVSRGEGPREPVPRELTFAFENRDVRAFLRAILLGDKRALTPALRDAFIDTGAAHILAISGLHLGIVAWGFYRLALFVLLLFGSMRQLGRPRVWASLGTLVFLWAFVLSISTSAATLRAAVVGSCVLAAFVAARRPKALELLALAATALILAEPTVIATASFQLSFGAATGLVLGARWLKKDDPLGRPSSLLQRARSPLIALFWFSTVAWLVTMPLCLAFFGQCSPLGLLCNVALVPLASLVIIPLAFIWLLVATLSEPLGVLLAQLIEGVFVFFLDAVGGMAEFAGSSQTVSLDHSVGLALCVAVLLILSRRREFLLLGMMFVLLSGFALFDATSRGLRMTMLDVGHGDAIVLRAPGGGSLMVDTGGSRRIASRNDRLADRRLIPALARLGVQRIDVLVITHAHADHVGALWRLAQRVPVGQLWLSPCATAHPMVRRAASAVAAHGGEIFVVHAGTQLTFSGLDIDVLWPPADSRRPDGSCRLGLNDASVVLRVSFGGRRILLTGDLEAQGEEALLSSGVDLRADVLKVGHHGSRSSTSAPFLRAVDPRIALVSGVWRPGNMPPHGQVLERLQRGQIATWITSRDGAIDVEIQKDGRLRSGSASSDRVLRKRPSPWAWR